MFKNAQWIGLAREEIQEKQIIQGDMNGRFVYFRKAFWLEEDKLPWQLQIDISANSRYRLWINGTGIQSGPLRSDRYRHFYETIDCGKYLKSGENVIAVQVLLCDRSYSKHKGFEREPVFGVASLPNGHRLGLEGAVRNAAGEELIDLTTGNTDWKVYLDASYYLDSIPVGSDCMGATLEHIDFGKVPHTWKEAGFDDSNWRLGERIESVEWNDFVKSVGLYEAYHMKERPIALLYEKEAALTEELGTKIFGENTLICIPAGTSTKVTFALPYVMNVFPTFRFQGGKGAKVTYTYFERFEKKGQDIKRDDYRNGDICEYYMEDWILLDGTQIRHEPFWVRSFRFLQIKVEAAEEDVIMHRPTYHKTGYPLQPESWIRSSLSWVEKLYEMCQHTLEGCMLETYMDCPTWEQFQYPMDTRLQALFTYVCSKDTDMARKALEDFHCSKVPEGLVLGRAPAGYMQIISTFSLHYIFMIWEFYQRTGDASVLKRYRTDVDEILNYYEDCIDESGLVGRVGYWPFVDWQDDWKETGGIPKAYQHGPSTIINLIYIYALQTGAKIMEASGRSSVAKEYAKRCEALGKLLQETCWDAHREMFREGPAFEQFTQEAQSWAVMGGLLTGEQARRTLTHTFRDEDVLTCYFSTCYELFRACEMADCYELTERKMQEWIGLIDMHCGTCPETPVNCRSECHAWSALPMYELMSAIAGIQRCKPGEENYRIFPHLHAVPDLQGEYCTVCGPIRFRYQKNGQQWEYEINLPKGCSGTFTPDGMTEYCLCEGRNFFMKEMYS